MINSVVAIEFVEMHLIIFAVFTDIKMYVNVLFSYLGKTGSRFGK